MSAAKKHQSFDWIPLTAPVPTQPAFGVPPIVDSSSIKQPIFQRGPRVYATPPTGEEEIASPPPLPNAPTTNVIAMLLTGLLPAVGMGFIVFAYSSTTNALFFVIPIAVLSLAAGIYSLYTFFHERKQYKRTVAKRNEVYRAYLAGVRSRLELLRDSHKQANLSTHASPEDCRARAERRDKHLWERSPSDPDFLHLRLGLGSIPASFTIKAPSAPQVALEPDSLLDEAQALAREFREVPGAAVVLPLRSVGVAGLAGSRQLIQETIRALILQIASHHSPDEVKLVLAFPEEEMAEWTWVRWLPHTWNEGRTRRFVACTRNAIGGILDDLGNVLKMRQAHAQASTGQAPRSYLPVYVVIFADPALFSGDGGGSHAANGQMILNQGPALGVYSLVAADRPEILQKQVGAVVDLTGGSKRLRTVAPPSVETVFGHETVDTTTAEQFSKVLAPLRLSSGSGGTGELPARVPLFDVLGIQTVEALDAADLWRNSRPFESLSVPIGLRIGGEPLYLDMQQREHQHGPNGLVAGTTGWGKTELLVGLVVTLATYFRPDEVAFAILDFKGGSMVDQVDSLPHVVSKITDREFELVSRALVSLEAELDKRKRIFTEAGAKLDYVITDLDIYMPLYRDGKVEEAVPYLVLIVDEFTMLQSRRPEEMDKFLRLAIQGRSYGFRMILAAQKPQVSAQIEANTRFRFCLRVAQPGESQEMIKRPDAAFLPVRGRAYFRVGQDEVFELFQAVWNSAPYLPISEDAKAAREIREVGLDGSRTHLWPRDTSAQERQSGDTQLQVLTRHLGEMAERQNIKRTSEVWLPPLPDRVLLDDLRRDLPGGWNGSGWLPVTRWLSPAIGLVDDPVRQVQHTLQIPLGQEGHLVIYGAPLSGKSTFAQTLVTSIVLDHSPDQVWLYLIDFGGHSLTLFNQLPHVGAVILPEEEERLTRLVIYLRDQLQQRKRLLSRAQAGTFAAYREQMTETVPAIVVVVDNYSAFASKYEDLAESFSTLVEEGAGLGIHLVLTGTIPNRLMNFVKLAVALELTDPGDYSSVLGSQAGLTLSSHVPGRGLVRADKPLEFQTAVPAAGETDTSRNIGLTLLIEKMAEACPQPNVSPVRTLREIVPLSELLPPDDTRSTRSNPGLAVPLVVDSETLQPLPVNLDSGPHFIITGRPEGGKTTLLQTWLLALAESFPAEKLRFYLVGLGSTDLLPFMRLPHAIAHAEDDSEVGEILNGIDQDLQARFKLVSKVLRDAGGILPLGEQEKLLSSLPALVLAIDDLDQFIAGVSEENRQLLGQLLKGKRGLRFHLMLAGPRSAFVHAYDDFVTLVKAGRAGFVLGTSDPDDLDVLGLPGSYRAGSKWLPGGRGYLAFRKGYHRVQTATCHVGSPSLGEWIERIRARS